MATAQLLSNAPWSTLGGNQQRRSQAVDVFSTLPRNGFKSSWLFQQMAGLALQQGPVVSADSVFVTATSPGSANTQMSYLL